MAKREIVIIEKDSEFLHKISKPIEVFDKKLFDLLDDLKDTLKIEDGVGLAAPQVGMLKRAIICELDGKIVEMVNPKITSKSGELCDKEGCLSVKGRQFTILRPEKITVKYFDRNANEKTLKLKEFDARIVSHEIDHLDGILITDIKLIETEDD
ncbi:MAG: peptide deformylase [Firmicutes bacterium]|nr:peptide deformylase [Bacillota bacterium]